MRFLHVDNIKDRTTWKPKIVDVNKYSSSKQRKEERNPICIRST